MLLLNLGSGESLFEMNKTKTQLILGAACVNITVDVQKKKNAA